MESELIDLFKSTRTATEELCEPLKTEDYSVQPFVDVSPPKWHLAHSTWFFEQFILAKYRQNYKVFDDDFSFLFNSYYNNVGERVLRPNRGNMTRPAVSEVYEYRTYVTTALIELLESNSSSEIEELVRLGINHEQQHQELLAYDIKYILGHQPTFPNFDTKLKLRAQSSPTHFVAIKEGVYDIGFEGNDFCFDNELGRHKVFLHDFEISNKLITNGEFLEFIEAGGYQNFNLWHAEGWDHIEKNEIVAPMYWHKVQGKWMYYQFNGLEEIELEQPVMNISFYEAFAFAEWKGMRLPTEFEWEVASDLFDWGHLWEWTNSAYLPYPNFSKQPGALGEYNGKFMVSQMVLRGGSFATAPNHSRKTYRNFFHPSCRWQFGGIRLAK